MFRLLGSYEALDGGNLSDALVDFTGGVSELVLLQSEAGEKLYEEEERRAELFSRLMQAGLNKMFYQTKKLGKFWY